MLSYHCYTLSWYVTIYNIKEAYCLHLWSFSNKNILTKYTERTTSTNLLKTCKKKVTFIFIAIPEQNRR